jgi:hypothetical protein
MSAPPRANTQETTEFEFHISPVSGPDGDVRAGDRW